VGRDEPLPPRIINEDEELSRLANDCRAKVRKELGGSDED